MDPAITISGEATTEVAAADEFFIDVREMVVLSVRIQRGNLSSEGLSAAQAHVLAVLTATAEVCAGVVDATDLFRGARALTRARQLSMYILSHNYRISRAKIARLFQLNTETVAYSIRQVTKDLEARAGLLHDISERINKGRSAPALN
jgi:hypothetical protein